jgi:hypothetical protein
MARGNWGYPGLFTGLFAGIFTGISNRWENGRVRRVWANNYLGVLVLDMPGLIGAGSTLVQGEL